MSLPTVIPGMAFAQHPIANSERVLLVNPPVYEYRLEWANWHHPLGLEQIGALLEAKGADVKLIDCLASDKKRMPKRKINAQTIEGYEFVRWAFGLTMPSLKMTLRKLKPWRPDVVMLTTLNSLWWQGAVDTIGVIHEVFPEAQIVLGGMYPTYACDHAIQHSGADLLVTGPVPEAPNASIHRRKRSPSRKSAGVLFYREQRTGHRGGVPRTADDIVEEISAGVKDGILEFVFFDERIHPDDHDAFSSMLGALAEAKHGARIVFPGNILPKLVDARVATLLRPAGVKQIYLRCELLFGDQSVEYADDLKSYTECASFLTDVGGYRPRAGDVAAMLVVGLPFENLEQVSERLIHLAHIVGSVFLVPFQFVPELHQQAVFRRALANNGHWSMDDFNSKLYPLGRLSKYPLEEYMELLRLAALVNSKYRSKTFDFLGDGLAAQLLRESLRSQRWNPFLTDADEDDQPIIELTSHNESIR